MCERDAKRLVNAVIVSQTLRNDQPTGQPKRLICHDNVSTSCMGRFTINGYEVVDGDVKATGNGAHVYVPKRWRGADVKVVRTSEPNNE